MRTNIAPTPIRTHEGGVAQHISPEAQLRRSVMACLLWENSFYESGENIASRIASLVARVGPQTVAGIALEARERMKLRHAPLWILRAMASLPEHKQRVGRVLPEIVQRPDELTEFVSLYWKDRRQPLSAQVKKGLAKAFTQFDSYQLAKYNRDDAIKLRDVLFLVHPKPVNPAQAEVWKALVDGTLQPADTWEVALSAGKGKRETWTRLLTENKLGGLALLRNLRNMKEAGVGDDLIRQAIGRMRTDKILPYRFIAAARHAPQLEPELEQAMFKCMGDDQLQGTTVVMVDVSGSMHNVLSAKSDLLRIDAACGLAMLAREICRHVTVVTFSNKLVELPPRRGFALRDAICNSQEHSGTYLGQAVAGVNKAVQYDRLIVISDEQTADAVPNPKGKGYMINVASEKNGIGYGSWTHMDGFSESTLRYIQEVESLAGQAAVRQESN